jgi:hypothetical protein
MPSFTLSPDAAYKQKVGERFVRAIRKEAFEEFNPDVLGLGNLAAKSQSIPAIAAYFDLEAFTVFCREMEPVLSVATFMSGFLNWIFSAIRREAVFEEFPEGFRLWHDLPFFTKFTGDGLLVLWDTRSMSQMSQHNMISSCINILLKYKNEFLPAMQRDVIDAPPKLRCGIAKGTVFSVGNGEDYVGSCINMAARLQKLAGLSVAFSRRGFDPEATWSKEILANWLLKKVSIRGIGDHELVFVEKWEFDGLPTEDKKIFSDP